jgi:hypothetical protein
VVDAVVKERVKDLLVLQQHEEGKSRRGQLDDEVAAVEEGRKG